jgi:hypothetical protein
LVGDGQQLAAHPVDGGVLEAAGEAPTLERAQWPGHRRHPGAVIEHVELDELTGTGSPARAQLPRLAAFAPTRSTTVEAGVPSTTTSGRSRSASS